MDLAATNLTLPVDVITEIRNSAAAGMEITAHEQPVSFYGSSQVGYIILDPQTGAGAYKIGGGENGGEVDFSDSPLDFLISLLSEKTGFLKYLGDSLGRIKTVYDTAVDAGECGLPFALVKLAAVTAFVIGLTGLLMPYLFLLGLGAALVYIVVLRILIIEIVLATYFASRFECK